MENRLNAAAATASRPAPTPYVKRQIVRSAPRRDLQVSSMPRTNVMVVGNAEATRIVVDMLRLDLRGPVIKWRAGQPLALPVPGSCATLVLENLARLTDEEQIRVLRWLDDVRGKIRVVSTAGAPIWPRVQNGEFNEVLYYRLNTVFVDMGTA
jgi:Sigma-54 interaction domain